MFSKVSIGFAKLSWSLRKLRLPIDSTYRVLEVGSGGNPHPASDVLLEKYIDNSHRLKSIQIDRPMVLADACKMPFKDGAFDFVIAFHVLEHVDRPEQFIEELMRVAKAGYIETPNAMYERLHPFDVHLLEVAERDGRLVIRRKSGPVDDVFLSDMGWLDDDRDWRHFFDSHPRAFHVCHQWKGRIKYDVVNPEQSLGWFKEPLPGLLAVGDAASLAKVSTRRSARTRLISLLRWFYTMNKPRALDLSSLLACPSCRSSVSRQLGCYRCDGCGNEYRSEPVPDFTSAVTVPRSLPYQETF